jgi:hypothetical protein
MARWEADGTIERPAEEVFDFVADCRNELAWNPRAVQIDKLSDGPIGLGTRFRGRYKGGMTLEIEVVEYARPSRIAWDVVGRGIRMRPVITVTPTAGGSHVKMTADVTPSGIMRFVFPVMGPIFRRQNLAAGANLKRVLEARSPATSADATAMV